MWTPAIRAGAYFGLWPSLLGSHLSPTAIRQEMWAPAIRAGTYLFWPLAVSRCQLSLTHGYQARNVGSRDTSRHILIVALSYVLRLYLVYQNKKPERENRLNRKIPEKPETDFFQK